MNFRIGEHVIPAQNVDDRIPHKKGVVKQVYLPDLIELEIAGEIWLLETKHVRKL